MTVSVKRIVMATQDFNIALLIAYVDLDWFDSALPVKWDLQWGEDILASLANDVITQKPGSDPKQYLLTTAAHDLSNDPWHPRAVVVHQS